MAGRIEDYAIVGDMQSVALIGTDGSVDWLCLPRFDSEACFAALLGTQDHGHWRIAPAADPGTSSATRRYAGDTLILETQWETPDGIALVTDFMPPRNDDEPPVLVRIVTGVSGTVEMNVALKIRFGYGSIVPWTLKTPNGITSTAGPDSTWLRTPVPLAGRDLAHTATFSVAAGDRVPFVFTYLPSHLGEPASLDAFAALEATRKFWDGWVSRCTYDGPYRDAVIRSLMALTYQPTGGIVAAATTSLPEDIGGVRNWDYRYCWLRDATITLEALLRTGYTDEAKAWRLWLGRAIAGNPQDIQIMYGVAGERRLAEWEADWLPGYESSAPVRIGNAAAGQLQLDVYGEVIDALQLSCKSGLHDDQHTWALQRSLLGFLEQHWNSPDEGLWRDLMQDGLLRRYELPPGGTSAVDGLPGSEGAFLACSFWLANALELSGRHEECVELFERLLALRNDVGLLSEEYDPRYGRLVGNMPQAFSHVPLVQTALNLSGHAEEHRRGTSRDERRSVPG